MVASSRYRASSSNKEIVSYFRRGTQERGSSDRFTSKVWANFKTKLRELIPRWDEVIPQGYWLCFFVCDISVKDSVPLLIPFKVQSTTDVGN